MTDVMLVDAAHNTASSSRAQHYTKFARALHVACYARLARLACMCHVFGILKYRNYQLSQLCHYHFKVIVKICMLYCDFRTVFT